MRSKLTPEIQAEIGKNITLGMPLKYASEAAGVPERTFYQWMEQGEKQNSGKYRDFYDYCENCKSVAVKLHMTLITKAAKEDGSWQASAWILERRHPEEFGRREKVELSGNMKHTGSINLHNLSDEELMEIIQNDTPK